MMILNKQHFIVSDFYWTSYLLLCIISNLLDIKDDNATGRNSLKLQIG